MAKIIEYNFSRKKARVERDLLTSSYGALLEDLENKKILLGEMVMQARIFLAKMGMNPSDFILSESYLKDYLCTSFEEDDAEEDRYVEIVYLNGTENRIVALCQFASFDEDEIILTYQVYQLEHVREGNRNWEIYHHGMHMWCDYGEDCFDIPQVFREIGMLSTQAEEGSD